MAIVVVTNNPLLKDEEHSLFVEGTFRDVLVTVRDMVYRGYELITHPLFASSRMMFSPYRTVILGNERDAISQDECKIAEDSIISLDKFTANRKPPSDHDADYADVDYRLYQAALDEIAMLRGSQRI